MYIIIVNYFKFILFIFVLIISGCGKSDLKNPSLIKKYKGSVSIKLCKGVDSSGAPQNITRKFSPDDTVYLYALWRGLYGDHITLCLFKDPLGYTVFNTEVDIKNSNGSQATWYWFKYNEGDIKKGIWEAYLYIDGKFAGSKEILIR